MAQDARDTATKDKASSMSAGIVVDNQYNPPPADRDGRTWVRTTALVQAEAEVLYELWRDVEKTPLWQEQMISVHRTGPKTSHWVMRVGDTRVEWNAEIMNDEPGRRIAWRSLDGDIQQAGEVIFEPSPGNRGTNVILLQEFGMGKIASALATMKGRNPRQAVIENLRHFKALAETGEIPRSQTPTHGPRGVIAGWKKSMYGETVTTPAGTAKTVEGVHS
jgi:uncharacterized membrane protein